ncbi:hypothetical protein E2C01_044976 [Portunus trituberculatus]|uniref:Uncharacterized protein n=1 Tax=Portunus trituberculatus TaxID=210409 RepID=A0A5B7FZU0_PORTR|nr:hypothetical protein [Portunus trituberculatus]
MDKEVQMDKWEALRVKFMVHTTNHPSVAFSLSGENLFPRVFRQCHLGGQCFLQTEVLSSLNMGKNKYLSQETIAQIIALHKAGHQTKEIIELVGVGKTSVCKWVAIFKKEGGCDTLGYKPRKKYPKKTSHHATNVIKRQLVHNPRVTVRIPQSEGLKSAQQL